MGKKEYNYEYEEGRIVRATEADIELSGEIVTSKVIVNTVNYYYDEEIELYYLQSRYYDASVSKFINADDEYIFNTYCYGIGVFCFYNYCNNDPINRKDSFGNWFITAIKAFVAATKTVHDVVSGTVKSFVTSSIKGYTALQTTLSVLINAGIAVVKNVFLFLIDRYLSFAKKVLNKLVEGISAFLSEMGDQWISTGDFNRINWLRCLKVGFRGIAFSFVDAGLGRWQETVLTKLTSGLKDAKFTCDVIYEIYVVLFVDLPQNVINALI